MSGQRCESDDCIAVATVALVYDDRGEFYFCKRHFELIEERCAAAGAERKRLIAAGVSTRMADHIISARIDRREV